MEKTYLKNDVLKLQYEEKKRSVETSYAELQKMKAAEKASEVENAETAHKTAVEKV